MYRNEMHIEGEKGQERQDIRKEDEREEERDFPRVENVVIDTTHTTARVFFFFFLLTRNPPHATLVGDDISTIHCLTLIEQGHKKTNITWPNGARNIKKGKREARGTWQ